MITKYKLIQGDIARISEGNACPVFLERDREICYVDDLIELLEDKDFIDKRKLIEHLNSD